MAKIRIKRSNVVTSGVAKAPTAAQMDYGELAVNYNTFDPVLFIKDSNNDVIRLTGNDLITSVFGRTGAITANVGDYSSFYAPLSHVGSGGNAHAAVTTTDNGFMSSADKVKLNGITAGAQPNVITSWNGRTTSNIVPTAGDYDLTQLGDVAISSPSNGQVIAYNSVSQKFEVANQTPGTNLQKALYNNRVLITSSTGTDIEIPAATTSVAGVMHADDKTKLDGVATGAEVNVQANWNTTDNTLDSFIQNKPAVPTTLGSLTDVDVTGLANDKIIKYNSSSSQWELDNLSTATGGTVTSIVAGSGLNGGTITTSGTISINNSYLHSTLDTRYKAISYEPDPVTASSGGSGGQDGLMTAAMAEKLNGIANNAEVNVNADFNATSGDALILNKPNIPADLGDLGDVTLSSSQANQVLQYNGSNWVNSGVTLNELSDVSAGSPSSGQILSYNGSNWALANAPSGTTNLGTSTSTSNVTITSSSGSNTAIEVANSSRAGVLDTTLFNKLNGIQTGAEVNPTNISAFNNNVGYTTDVPAITSNGSTPSLNSGISAAEVRSLIGAGTGTSNFDGNYNSLNGAPNLATVATSGEYTDLNNKPSLFSGSYTDLTNTPTIPGPTNLGTSTTTTTVSINSSTGQNATINGATSTTSGIMTKAHVDDLTTALNTANSANTAAGSANSNANLRVLKSGDTMTGDLEIGSNEITSTGDLGLSSNTGGASAVGFTLNGGAGASLLGLGVMGIRYQTGNSWIGFKYSSSSVMQAFYNGNSWGNVAITSSDIRLKEDIDTIELGALSTVLALNPVQYKWKDKVGYYSKNTLASNPDGFYKYGFIADEVASVLPGALVVEDPSDENPDPIKDYEDRAILATLCKAIQELSAEVTALKQQVNT